MSRPSLFTEELAIEICSRLASGESLRSICRDETMPGLTTTYRWLSERESFRNQYARAREDQADTLADEILEISDDGRNDWMIRVRDEDGKESGAVLNAEHIQRSRLRVDARKWIAAKLKPKKYGDKVIQEVSGIDGGPIVTRDDTPGIGAVKAALAAMLVRAQSTSPELDGGTS